MKRLAFFLFALLFLSVTMNAYSSEAEFADDAKLFIQKRLELEDVKIEDLKIKLAVTKEEFDSEVIETPEAWESDVKEIMASMFEDEIEKNIQISFKMEGKNYFCYADVKRTDRTEYNLKRKVAVGNCHDEKGRRVKLLEKKFLFGGHDKVFGLKEKKIEIDGDEIDSLKERVEGKEISREDSKVSKKSATKSL